MARQAKSPKGPSKDGMPEYFTIKYEDLQTNFVRVRDLFNGAFGSVSVWKRKDSAFGLKDIPDEVVVKKIVDKSSTRIYSKSDVSCLSNLSHDNVIKFHGHFIWSATEPWKMEGDGIIMEMCSGTLEDLMLWNEGHELLRRKLRHYEVAIIMKQLLKGIQYLHEKSITHKDIKPANILLVCADKEFEWETMSVTKLTLKVGDFSLSRSYDKEESMRFPDSLVFIPPDIRKLLMEGKDTPDDPKIDLWATGLVSLILLLGELPPAIKNVEDIANLVIPSNVCKYAIESLSPFTRKLHDICQTNKHFLTFLLKQLQIESSQRASAKELLGHGYLTEIQANLADVFEAVDRSDVDSLEFLLDNIECNELITQHDDHPLCYASRQGKPDCVRVLVEKLKGDEIDSSGAMIVASEKDNKEIVELLVSHGGNINVQSHRDLMTPLMYFSLNGNLDAVRWLTSESVSAEIDKKDSDGRTALLKASANGHLSVVKHLVQAKARMLARNRQMSISESSCIGDSDNFGMTALHFACRFGHREIVQYLVSELNDDVNKTASGPFLKWLAHDDGDFNPLHFACYDDKNIDVVRYLVNSLHMDVNSRTKRGRTPVFTACSRSAFGIVKFLVEELKANVTGVLNVFGENLLHTVMKSKTGLNIELMNYLVVIHSIQASEKDNFGKNALHHFSERSLGYGDDAIDVFKYLLTTCRVSPSAADREGKTILHYNAYQGNTNVVKYLVKTHGLDPTSTDLLGRSALHYAVMEIGYFNFDFVRYLVEECHVNPAKADSDGDNVLFILSRNDGYLNRGSFDYLLKASGLGINARDKNGRTVLHNVALNSYDLSDVKHLLETCHCNINVTDNEGLTADELATRHLHEKEDQYEKKCRAQVIKYLKSMRKSCRK